MRILFLSPTFPLPANNGCRLRIWANLRVLAAEGHQISLVTFAGKGEADLYRAELSSVCATLDAIPLALASLSSGKQHVDRVLALRSENPYAVFRFRSTEMQKRIAQRLQARETDLVWCEMPYLMINLPKVSTCPLILDCQNVEHVLLNRYADRESNYFKRAYARSEGRKLKTWEQRCSSAAALVGVCSEYDRELMRELCPGRTVHVIPNVVDLSSYWPAPDPGTPTVIYTGGMDWYPNRDAVTFFAREILPTVQNQHPYARFVVAGRAPTDGFRRQFSDCPAVHFTGTVDDMRTELAKAAVCVVPLRIGSGTRLKILEAAAMSRPIVSTNLGVEGLEFIDNREILIADEPEAFAIHVSQLLASSEKRAAIGTAARSVVERRYSHVVLRSVLRDALSEIGIPRAHVSRGTGGGMNTTETY